MPWIARPASRAAAIRASRSWLSESARSDMGLFQTPGVYTKQPWRHRDRPPGARLTGNVDMRCGLRRGPWRPPPSPLRRPARRKNSVLTVGLDLDGQLGLQVEAVGVPVLDAEIPAIESGGRIRAADL